MNSEDCLFQSTGSALDNFEVIRRGGVTRLKFLLVLSLMTVLVPAPARAASCKSLSSLSLPKTTITLAQSVPGGGFELPSAVQPPRQRAAQESQLFKDLPPFCRVAATIRPTKDSDIKIEVWMPASGWNGKLLSVGNGGWAGDINYAGLSQSLREGFATASTDTGHASWGTKFALGHPEKLIDFGYRSIHEMTVQAKAIIAAFYGGSPRLSYWNGCSTGGYQGLSEAQRFPGDYNGIVEGDPANFFTHLMFSTIWPAEIMLKNPAGFLPPSKRRLLHQAVVKACDALDGVSDGMLSDPTRCHFDPRELECQGPDGPGCLTAAQVEAVRMMYSGPSNPRTGQGIFPGPEPGSELGWRFEARPPGPDDIRLEFFKYVVFKDPDWKWQTLNFDADVALADSRSGDVLNAINPDLRAFEARGGKLLMYHGWSDPLIAPLNSVNYYQSVVNKMGGTGKTRGFIRLFMVPGMGHCHGGPGPDSFDKMGVLEQWVEHGAAPDALIASHRTDKVVDMTRPLCPYPEVAHWKGVGSTNDAANFVCTVEDRRRTSDASSGPGPFAPASRPRKLITDDPHAIDQSASLFGGKITVPSE
jgi:Tannase and feruloyl esterase